MGVTDEPEPAAAAGLDLRMPLLAVCAWASVLAVDLLPTHLLVALLLSVPAGGGVLAILGRRNASDNRSAVRLVVACGVVGVAAGLVSWGHQTRTQDNPVAALAADSATVTAEVQVTGDPRPLTGPYGDQVLVRANVMSVTGRGHAWRLRAPVLLLADRWPDDVALGARVRFAGRLLPSDRGDVSGLLRVSDTPTLVRAPDVWWRGANAVRESIGRSVAARPPGPRALVPALVSGDDHAIPDQLAADFRTTGLTHLLAVSGTNLTLVIGFLVVLGRWVGVRGRGVVLLGALGIVGFVLLARTEPSVLRAAAMGVVALFATAVDGARRGLRALAVAVVALLLIAPGLATSIGFGLSVSATAGILVVAPGLSRAMAGWLPGWLADALAIPLAAQLACIPLIAAISGQISLVAVLANLLAAPVVGPATVLGLGGGLVGLVWPWAGAVLGLGASLCVSWLVFVATRGADLPGAAVTWGTGAWSLIALVVLTALAIRWGPRLLRRPLTAGAACLALVSPLLLHVVLTRTPLGGWVGGDWPPPGWVMVMCDVGQGDGLVLNAGTAGGRTRVVVVDSGPDPTTMDHCLDRIGVSEVPLVVLTHFHADHVDGLPGVLAGRSVGQILVTSDRDPAYGARLVDQAAQPRGVPVRVAAYATTTRVGQVTMQDLWPPPGWQADNPNDASIVLLVDIRGVRLLLCGDVEPPSQEGIARAWPGLRTDVLKVPHHGSGSQDFSWLAGLDARVGLVSVGVDNDYGHPAPETLNALTGDGLRVLRTDRSGDVAVWSVHGRLGVSTGG